MEIKKPTYEELEHEVNRLRKMQENKTHTKDAINFHHASMHKINNAIHTAADIDEMMSTVLQAVLDLFDSERAWLLFPCDPDAKSWTVPMERTKPGFEGVHALGEEIPMLPKEAEAFKRMQSSHEVVTYDYTQNPKEISIRFSILSEMHMPLHPKTGKAWLFGMHQCTYARVWTNEEKVLFKEIGNRISDALNSFLFLNELKASERKFKEISEISPLAIYLSSGMEQKAEYINPTFVKLFGYTIEEVPIVAKWWQLAYPDENYRNKLVAGWQEKVEHAINTKSDIEPMETVVTCKDGSEKNIIWGYISTNIQYWAFGLDITEQKQAEESLRTSKDSIENLTNSLTDIVISVKMPERVIEWSNNSIRSIAYEPTEIIGQTTAFLFTDEENYLDFSIRLQQSLEEGNVVFLTEQLFKKKNGETFSADVRVTCDKEDGEIVRATSIIRDITKQKQADYRLQESEEKYKALFDNAPLSYQSLDEDGRFININPSWLRTLGYEQNEVIGENFADFLHPNWKPHFEKHFPTFKKRGYVNDVQYKIKHKKGHFIDISFEGCIGYLPDGSFKQTYCVFQDITERRKAEEEILQSQKNYQSLFDNSPVPLWEEDFSEVKKYIETLQKRNISDFREYFKNNPDKVRECVPLIKISDVNISVLKLHEAESKDEFYNGLSSLFTNTSYEAFIEELITIAEGRFECEFESIVKTLKGNEKEVHLKWMVVPGYEETFEKIYVSTVDITERKQAEDELKKQKEMFELVINSVPTRIFWKDLNSVYLGCNQAFAEAVGHEKREAVIGKNDFDLIWGEEAQKYIDDDKQVMSSGIPKIAYAEDYTTPNGENVWWSSNKMPLLDNNGKIFGVLAISEDITERKQAEEELKNITERLQFATEGSNIGTWHWNTITGELIWSSLMNQLFDVPQEEVINYERFSQALHPDDRASTDEAVSIALENHTVFNTEYRCVWRDGSVHWRKALGRGYYDESGRNIRMEGVVFDINDQKNAEQSLIDSEQRLNEAQRMASIGYWIQDVPSKKLIWSDETFRIFEIDKEFSGELFDAFESKIHPENREAVTKAFNNSLKSKKPYEITHRIQMSDGRVKYVHERSETEYDESGNPVKSIGTVQDITELKKTEEKLREIQDNLEKLVDERTKELEEKYAELERMNKLFVGRELRMVELKEKIRKLESKE